MPEQKKVIISRNVKFFEETNSKELGQISELLINQQPINQAPSENFELERETITSLYEQPISITRGSESSRSSTEEESEIKSDDVSARAPNILSLRNREVTRFVEEDELDVFGFHTEIPMSVALNGSESNLWMNSIAEEIKNILLKDTFHLVEKPKSKRCISSRFILTNKFDSDGSLLKNKARFVARGFSQKPNEDFGQTYAPVAKSGSIRLLSALAANLNLEIHQFDVTTAYLNGDLDEEIYMECPDNFGKILEHIIDNEISNSKISQKASDMLKLLNKGNKVLLLKKSLYGLKQAGRCWNVKLNEILTKFGAKQSVADPCVYYIRDDKGLTLMSVYIDDILFMSQNPDMLEKFKNHLNKDLEVKYSGLAKYCLGINFRQEKGIVTMSQSSYINELLKRFEMSDAKTVNSPMDISVKLKRSENCENLFPYRELVGGLMYLAVSTRPDIANTVSKLSQFLTCYDNTHWTAAKRVLRYLKKTINFGLIFRHTNDSLFGFTDSDWGNCPDNRKSYTGYCFILSGSVISYESRKQVTVALSSTESEYMALSDGTKEAIYLKKLLNELCSDGLGKVRIFVDNIGAIKLAENPVFHKRTKHIDIRHHFVREALRNEQIEICHVPTEEMGADILTKPLPSSKHFKCLDMLGIGDVNSCFHNVG